jgi:hypothetical protein
MKTDSNDRFQQLQEIVIDYFKDMDNETMIKFIDSFVFHLPITEHNGISDLIEKFLKDNGLENAYTNYIYDITHKDDSWRTSSGSEMTMINNVKNAFMNLAYNRFRNITPIVMKTADKIDNPPKVLKPAKKIKILVGNSDVAKGEVHAVCNINDSYAICSLMIEEDVVGETELTTDAITCKHCLSIINYCKSIQL